MWITRFLFSGLIAILFSSALRAQDMEEIQLAQQYYQQGEIEKSIALLNDLAKKDFNLPFIHNTYLEILLFNKSYDEAEKYLNKRLKKTPNDPYLLVDRATLYLRLNSSQARKDFDNAIAIATADPKLIRPFVTFLANKQYLDEAIQTYLLARKKRGNQTEFAIELAMIYRLNGDKDKMASEYINYLDQNPSALQYVQNSLQNVLTQTEDLDALELFLLDRVQSQPNNSNYTEILIWLYVQRKDFLNAFIQARAADKRFGKEGTQLLELGLISLDNDEFEQSLNIFQYVMNTYPQTTMYVAARRYQIGAREKMIKNRFPVERQEIVKLIIEYQELINNFGISRTTQEAAREKALLHAFYLDEIDTAISILTELIQSPQLTVQLRSQSKLDLGDLYILKNEPWESALLYSQVEKSEKESTLGHEAKLRNAKLSFYKGEFELAMAHLDILKKATTREVANDAMQLSLTIKDNIGYDSVTTVLKSYANAQLLIFTQKIAAAKDTLEKILSENLRHSLTDEVLWSLAHIEIKAANYTKSIEYLERIVTEYQYDILSDDAYFKMAQIYEKNLSDREKAMELYQNFLTKYPGSIHTDESRKRYRTLRGDFIN